MNQNDQTDAPGSICIAVYHPDSELLARQISSIQKQSETRWVCHVGIDGVDQQTAEVLAGLIGDDNRFVIHHFPDNVGFYRNFERTLAAVDANSPWIALADQDDYWYPEKIEQLLPVLMRDGVTLVSGQARLVTRDGIESGATARRVNGLAALMLDNQVTGSFSILRGSVLRAALPFPTPTDVAYHDHWLGIVAAGLGEIVVVDVVLQDYIQHGNNVIGEESGGSRILQRFRTLAARSSRSSRSAGIAGSVKYIRQHRWGWRVDMATLGLQRISDMSESNRRVLEPFARAILTVKLIKIVFRGIARRDVPPLRGLALLAGAATSKTTKAGAARSGAA